MPRKSWIPIVITLASLQSVTAWAQPTETADKAGAAGEVNRQAAPGVVAFTDTEGRATQTRTGMATAAIDRLSAPSLLNYIGSLFSAAHVNPAIEKHDKSAGPDRTKTVHTRAPSSAPAPCGPSSMSVDDVKALVVDRAGRYEVNPDLALAIAWTESRFDRVRNSPGGARGPMQLMPDTARLLNVIDVCDPVQNIDGGIRHLRALLDEFKNPIIAAAAYNAGAKAIHDNGGVPAYPETVRYVASVINHQLGLTFTTEPTKGGSGQETDVIGRTTIGARPPQFKGGVMQF